MHVRGQDAGGPEDHFMNRGLKVKIYTRSFDLRLYECSRGLYESMGFPMVRLTDRTADGYFYSMLEDGDCDIAVNIDEDAFVVDPGAVLDLITRVVEGGYANAGCPDGGNDALPRDGDPTITNPFFNVLDLRLIRAKFKYSELRALNDDREPYYPFFRWISENFNTLYLPAEKHHDGFSTILKDMEGRVICQHSWLARFYSMPSWVVNHFQPGMGMQKARIDALIDESYAIRGMERPHFSSAANIGFAADRLLRWAVKIPQRIARWPQKLKRKLSRP